MESFVLIICLVLSLVLGYIPVRWADRYKKEKMRKNREYLDRINKKK